MARFRKLPTVGQAARCAFHRGCPHMLRPPLPLRLPLPLPLPAPLPPAPLRSVGSASSSALPLHFLILFGGLKPVTLSASLLKESKTSSTSSDSRD